MNEQQLKTQLHIPPTIALLSTPDMKFNCPPPITLWQDVHIELHKPPPMNSSIPAQIVFFSPATIADSKPLLVLHRPAPIKELLHAAAFIAPLKIPVPPADTTLEHPPPIAAYNPDTVFAAPPDIVAKFDAIDTVLLQPPLTVAN